MSLPSRRMKFSCAQEELAKALNVVSFAVGANNTLPVLDNILIRAEGGTVQFLATDLEVIIEYLCTTPIEKPGAVTVPAKLLSSYINLLPAHEMVSLELMSGQALHLTSATSDTKIKGIPAEDFPSLPAFEEEAGVTLPVQKFLRAVNRVLFSASQNTARPILAGVYVHIGQEEVKIATTDSYRLSEARMGLEELWNGEPLVKIIPSSTMQDVARIFQKDSLSLKMRVSKNQIQFASETIRVTSRLIEGRFPEYEAIIPKKWESKITVNGSNFLQATKRVNLFAKENNFNIRLETNVDLGELLITTDSTEIGEERTKITGIGEGVETKIALNSRYVIDVLTNIGVEEVSFLVDGPLAPAVIRPKEEEDAYVHIIMPLKLN